MTAHEGPRLDRDVQSELGSRLRQRFGEPAGEMPSALARLLDALRERDIAPDGEPRQAAGILA